MEHKAVELRNVSKVYPGVRALDKVDFEVGRGEVHCLVGQNGCGKSTMIKIISGVEQPEPESEIYIDGALMKHLNAEISMAKGVQVIYQDLSLFPNLTVMENIAYRATMGQKSPFIHRSRGAKIAKEALDMVGVDIDLHSTVGALSIAQQQLVEIAKALTGELSLLILDEPTASLTRKEVNALFMVIKELKEKGISTLFVSHKLNEVFEIAERVTVMRDGKKIGVYQPTELNRDKLVYLMTGSKEMYALPAPIADDAEIIVEARKLSKARNYKDISFTLRKGEILGITGLLGSGRTELALTLFGMNPQDSGDLYIEGEKVILNSNQKALNAGIGYVPEDRLTCGLVLNQSIRDNMTISTMRDYLSTLRLIDEKKRDEALENKVKELDIKIVSADAAVKTLSGGNAQKVVLSKWLLVHPKVLILDEPTIGIDVIAKNSIHTLIKSLAEEQGMSIIMISDEVAEVENNCHRIMVMSNGKVVCEFTPGEISEEELLARYNLA